MTRFLRPSLGRSLFVGCKPCRGLVFFLPRFQAVFVGSTVQLQDAGSWKVKV